MKAGKQKHKTTKTLAMQSALENLAKQFDTKEIDLEEYLEGLSLLVAKNIKGQ